MSKELKEIIDSMVEYLQETDNWSCYVDSVNCNLEEGEENAITKFIKKTEALEESK